MKYSLLIAFALLSIGCGDSEEKKDGVNGYMYESIASNTSTLGLNNSNKSLEAENNFKEVASSPL